MLSLKNIKQLNDYLKTTSVLCEEILRVRETEKLFDNYTDYETSLSMRTHVPQDYYLFRFFDSKFTLFYHLNRKRYYIRLDMPKDFTKFTTRSFFYNVQEEFNLKVEGILVYLPPNISFEKVEYIFLTLIQLYIFWKRK